MNAVEFDRVSIVFGDQPDRAFALRVMVCDFNGQCVADVSSGPARPRERPATAGRTGIDHLLDADSGADL